jgi:hypothetical protein
MLPTIRARALWNAVTVEFAKMDPEIANTARIFAVTTEDPLIVPLNFVTA